MMQISGYRPINLSAGGILLFAVLISGVNSADIPPGVTLTMFNAGVGKHDWSQLGGTPSRNNATDVENAPTDWNVDTGQNIKWSMPLGSQAFGHVVVANGKVYVGTNNMAAYLQRYPQRVDLAVLLCFRESNGEFLWQHSIKKLPSGREHDWPLQGLKTTPIVEGDRLWMVTNRGEVVCLDTEGFRDGQNDGPVVSETPDVADATWDEQHEADIVWTFDMMKQLHVRQHNWTTCGATIWGDVLFVCTSNGVDESHITIPAPDAPSFIALDKHTGKVLWTDNSPGKNIMHGTWSSPAAGVFDGVPQVLFGGGDGWLYSFRADRWADGKPELLWKFDANPKDSVYLLGGRSTRNSIYAPPVIYDGLVYVTVGDDPDHGEGQGHLWCIDPTKRGDVSAELVVDEEGNIVPHQRLQATALIGALKPKAIPNPNSAVVWHYDHYDANGNGKFEFEETMHRTVGSPAIKGGILIIGDFAGLIHALHAKTGKVFWTCDALAAIWATPLIAGDTVYVTDEDGDVAIFPLSINPRNVRKREEPKPGEINYVPLRECNMINSVYTSPVFANNVLYIATKSRLFAIANK